MRLRRLLFLVLVIGVGWLVWHLISIEMGYSNRLELSDKFYKDDMDIHQTEDNHAIYHILNPSDDIKLSLNQDTYNIGDNMVYTIKNNGSEEAVFGTVYHIEMYIRDQWYTVPFKEDIAFNSLAYTVKGQSEMSQSIWLDALYRPLKQGRYRLIKGVNGDYYSTEFQVVKSSHDED